MPHIPIRVIIRITRQDPTRRPKVLRWVGYERRLAGLWETGYFI